MVEVEKKKITREGLRNAFKLYKYIKPFRREYGIGMFFLIGSTTTSLIFPKLLGYSFGGGASGTIYILLFSDCAFCECNRKNTGFFATGYL